jgi:selenide,water dikinase
VEVVLAMQYRMASDGGRAQFTLIGDGPTILGIHPPGVQRRFTEILRARGIALRLDTPVDRAEHGALVLRGGERLAADEVVWVTGAAAPAWPRASGLQTDAAGFIAVNAHLQSLSHPVVFAAGDVASMHNTPRPKSGVYAVRQGPPLAENLRRALRGEPLLDYHPQPRALALISAGDRYAVASYGPFAISGAWVWRWKDHIDTAFMRRYRVAQNPQ